MEEKELNEIIVVEQLPQIKQQLQIISDEVDKEIKYALSLEVNDDTVKEVKNVRARLNKINTTLETRRKYVKEAILAPYNDFLEVYDNLVKNKLNDADNTLKMRINTIEDEQKKSKEEELRMFAEQWFISKGIENIVKFEDIGLNITLSASIKSLKDQTIEFCERIFNDIKLIELEEFKDEILIEYKRCLDFGKSKLIVIQRQKQLEEIKNQQEQIQEQEKQEEKVIEKVEEIITPPKEVIEDDEVITVTFTITDTKEKILKLRDYLKENDINYG